MGEIGVFLGAVDGWVWAPCVLVVGALIGWIQATATDKANNAKKE